MKKNIKNTILIISCLFLSILAFSQEYGFEFIYDANGNRIERKYVLLPSSVDDFNPKDFNVEEDLKDYKVIIAPNPTPSWLRKNY